VAADINRLIQGAVTVQLVNLIIQRTPIVNNTDAEQAHSEQVDQTGNPLALVKPVNAEHTQKSQQNPGNVVVDGAD